MSDNSITGTITYTSTTDPTNSTTHPISIPLVTGQLDELTQLDTATSNIQHSYPLGTQTQFESLINSIKQLKDDTNTYLTELMSTHHTTNKQNNNNKKT